MRKGDLVKIKNSGGAYSTYRDFYRENNIDDSGYKECKHPKNWENAVFIVDYIGYHKYKPERKLASILLKTADGDLEKYLFNTVDLEVVGSTLDLPTSNFSILEDL